MKGGNDHETGRHNMLYLIHIFIKYKIFMEEIWKNLEGILEGHYQVSNLGRIKSLKRNFQYKFFTCKKCGEIEYRKRSSKLKIMKLQKDKRGYLMVYLTRARRNFQVHRLVAKAYIPNPENKPCVNHKNSIRADNRAENLEWCTYKDNSLHASKNNRFKPDKGEKCNLSKLTEKQIKKIRALRKKGIESKIVEKMFNISRTHVYRVKSKKTWKHIK